MVCCTDLSVPHPEVRTATWFRRDPRRRHSVVSEQRSPIGAPWRQLDVKQKTPVVLFESLHPDMLKKILGLVRQESQEGHISIERKIPFREILNSELLRSDRRIKDPSIGDQESSHTLLTKDHRLTIGGTES